MTSAADWIDEIKRAEGACEKWVERGRKIVKRYRDERSGGTETRQFNILWSNVQTLLPAVYSKTPKADVERRFRDKDPVGRTAAQILQRALDFELEHYPDFTSAMQNAVIDRLVPGRGVAWVRYAPVIASQSGMLSPDAGDVDGDELAGDDDSITEDTYEAVQHECAPVDYIAWEDFIHSPARTWEEVTWVGRRVFLGRDELVNRFEAGADVPMNAKPAGMTDDEVRQGKNRKKAEVYEIWDKSGKTVVWVCKDWPELLDEKPDPLQLDGFFPCPRPLYATLTTDSLVPVADFVYYQDQADELDDVTARISMLTEALRVIGVYDASATALRSLLNGGGNKMVAVDSWAMFAERGGIKGAVDWFPVEQIVVVIEKLYEARETIKQTIYEETGLADILRGASQASETATAQGLKARFASLRLKRTQNDVAQFASDLIRIKAEIMCTRYQPETLVQMSGIMQTADAQYIGPALELLKQEPLRQFRVEVAADSLVEMDEQAEKASRVEFLTAAGGFLREALPVAVQVPEMGPLLSEMLMFGIRGFKAGRTMEAAFESALERLQQRQPERVPPEIQQQIDAKTQEIAQREQAIQQAEGEVAAKAQDFERKVFEFEQTHRFDEERAAMQEKMRAMQEQMASVEIDAGFRDREIGIKERAAERDSQATDDDTKFKSSMAAMITQMVDSMRELSEQLAAVSEAMDAPTEVVRGADGRVSAVRRNGRERAVMRGADGRMIGVQ